MPHGAEVAWGGTKSGGASRGCGHFGDGRSRSGVASRSDSGMEGNGGAEGIGVE
jgi:hypothetical protein